MVRRCSIEVAAVLFGLLGASCGGDDGGGGADSGSDGASEAGDDDAPGDDDGSASDPDSTGSADDGGGLCGNGELDPDEECDNGSANSDTEPDACRTDCREAQCNDGVLDPMHGEECDDGVDNGGGPNQCRVTCVLPSCGDGAQDKGEACDDGNAEWGDACYECSRIWYFILNAPAGGSWSILRTTRDGEPTRIVEGEASQGIQQLALGEAGAILYVLRSSGSADRVMAFDPVDGTLLDEVDIGMAALGFDPEARAIVRGSDGLLWVALTGGGSTRMITVDPRSLMVSEVLDLGNVTVEDMAADTAGGLYLTTGSGNGIVRVDVAGPSSAAFADAGDSLSNPIGITYDPHEELLWVANNPPGAPVDVVRFDLAGAVTPYSIAGTDVEPYVRGMAIDVGGVVLAAEQNLDRIVAVQNFDAVQDIFTAMVEAPLDIEILEMTE